MPLELAVHPVILCSALCCLTELSIHVAIVDTLSCKARKFKELLKISGETVTGENVWKFLFSYSCFPNLYNQEILSEVANLVMSYVEVLWSYWVERQLHEILFFFIIGAKKAREVVFTVLRAACSDGDLSIAEAVEVAGDILAGNAIQYYNLNRAPKSDSNSYACPNFVKLATTVSQNNASLVRVIWVDASGQHRCRVSLYLSLSLMQKPSS